MSNEQPPKAPPKQETVATRISSGDYWIEVRENSPGVFIVTSDNVTKRVDLNIEDPTELGFSDWDNEVTNLDTTSNAISSFKVSLHLRWKDVEMKAEEGEVVEFHAPTIERLKEALTHLEIVPWFPREV